MTQPKDVTITDAVEGDFAAIRDIYAYYVANTTISLEEAAPSVEEMISRWRHSVEKSLPYLVAKMDGNIAGYAYAFPYRPRSAYRFTIEESVYVSRDYQGFGIGRRLLSELITRCQAQGYRQMLAVIAGADNTASIAFHNSMGFRQSGVLEKFGFKFDQWVDTMLMQREL